MWPKKGYAAYQSIRTYCRPEHILVWFYHCSSLSLSKVIAEKLLVTFYNLKLPWGNEEGLLVAILRFSVSILPVSQCLRVFRMILVQKRRLSIFSHWLRMERSQKWPDLRPPISIFRDITFIDNVTNINSCEIQGDRSVGVPMAITQTFFWGEVTWRDLMTWLWVTWIWNLCMCEKVCEQVTKNKNGGAEG